MPKPRKGTSEVFYDTFSDFPLDEQAIAIRILTEIHRQALKQSRKLAAQGSLIEEPASETSKATAKESLIGGS